MDWKTRLELSDVWESEDTKKISEAIATRLAALDLSAVGGGESNGLSVSAEAIREMRDELVVEVKELAEQEDPDVEDLDAFMAGLYDWADTHLGPRARLCWVDTLGVPKG